MHLVPPVNLQAGLPHFVRTRSGELLHGYSVSLFDAYPLVWRVSTSDIVPYLHLHDYEQFFTCFNPLNTKRRLLYLKTQFVPRRPLYLNTQSVPRRPVYLKTQFVPRCKHFSSRL